MAFPVALLSGMSTCKESFMAIQIVHHSQTHEVDIRIA